MAEQFWRSAVRFIKFPTKILICWQSENEIDTEPTRMQIFPVPPLRIILSWKDYEVETILVFVDILKRNENSL